MALRTPFALRRWATRIPRPVTIQMLKPPVKLQWGNLLLQTPLGLFGSDVTSQTVRYASHYYGLKGTKPSNHERTAVELANRKIKEVNVDHVPPRPFKNVWDDFQKELAKSNDGTELATSADNASELLSVPLTTDYSTESEFDKALFEAFKECLKNQIGTSDENTIILKAKGDYAVGFSRQKASAMNLLDARNLEKNYASSTSSGLNIDATPDHSVCLFQKRDGSWLVTDCFSIVELKMSDSNCETFHVLNNDAYEIDLARKHGALSQALMYNIGCIVLHRAKRGVLDLHIPIVIIAGQRKRASDTSTRTQRETLRWVSGDLIVPTARGGEFSYGIKGFGQFHNDNTIERNRSVEQALSLYMEAMLFGLVDAMVIQKKLEVGDKPLSGSASGKSIMIGNMELDLPLCASPIPGAVVAQDSNETHAWKVSQGELFKGEVDLYQLIEYSGGSLVSFGPKRRKSQRKTSVVVKISSTTVHNLLIAPRDCYSALSNLKRDTALAKEIGSVLYAAIDPDPGLITIMRDLTAHGYGSLEPMGCPEKLAVLWGGFQELAETVLLPMAKIRVIHSDIRPGYDFTANILCKITNDQGGIDKANMKLIDFDSFVTYNAWKGRNHVLDGRYFNCDDGWDPTTFVWWQCMAVAYSWKEKLTAEKLRTENGMGMMKKYLRGEVSGGPAWLKKYSSLAKLGRQISSDELKSTLKDLATEF